MKRQEYIQLLFPYVTLKLPQGFLLWSVIINVYLEMPVIDFERIWKWPLQGGNMEKVVYRFSRSKPQTWRYLRILITTGTADCPGTPKDPVLFSFIGKYVNDERTKSTILSDEDEPYPRILFIIYIIVGFYKCFAYVVYLPNVSTNWLPELRPRRILVKEKVLLLGLYITTNTVFYGTHTLWEDTKVFLALQSHMSYDFQTQNFFPWVTIVQQFNC